MTSSGGFRTEFHFRLISACQTFICRATDDSGASWEERLAELLEAIPQPESPIEDVMLRDALARLALSAKRARRSIGGPWVRQLNLAVVDIVNDNRPVRVAYAEWRKRRATGRAAENVERLHSMQQTPSIRDAIAPLASLTHCSDRTLRKRFRQRYGVSPRELRARTLALRIVEELRASDLKIESVAQKLGIRSPKDLYMTVRAHTGLTPAQLRRLPAEQAQAMLDQLGARIPRPATQATSGDVSSAGFANQN